MMTQSAATELYNIASQIAALTDQAARVAAESPGIEALADDIDALDTLGRGVRQLRSIALSNRIE